MSQNIYNIVAERSSTNDGCVNISFEVKSTEEIIAYEVYSVSDSGQKKRARFLQTRPQITMGNLAKDMGYIFEVQAVYHGESFSEAVRSNHVDGVGTSRNNQKKDRKEDNDGRDNDPANEGRIKATTITCYYKIGDRIKESKHVYKGQFSYIFDRFKDKIPPRKVAIKILSASDYETWNQLEGDGEEYSLKMTRMVREAKHMLELIEHENLVQYIHSCPADSKPTLFYIFMELCSEKTLADRISKLKEYGEFNDRAYCKAIIRRLALAVHYMHGQGICHRDIKPSNILFTEGGGVVKISDFGFSKKLHNGDFSSTSNIGTSGYCPPESFTASGKVKVSDRGDVFSLGLVYFYILTKGKHPFRNVPTEGKGPEPQQQQNNICDLHKKPILEGLTGSDAALAKDLITKMIKKDKLQRLEMDNVMKHAYFWDAEQLIGFYILVHDSLLKNSQNATDEFRSMASTEYVVEHVEDYFCLAKAGAQAMTPEAEGLAQNQSKVERTLKNKFLAPLHKDVRTYVNMVQNIFKRSPKSPSQEFVDDQLRVRRFFLAAQSAAEAKARTRNNDLTRAQINEDTQRDMEEKMLQESYYKLSSSTAQSYMQTTHRVLKALDRNAGVKSDNKPDLSYRGNSDVSDKGSEDDRNEMSQSSKSFIETTELPIKSIPSSVSPNNVEQVVDRILGDYTEGKITERDPSLGNRRNIPLTIPYIISVIDSLDDMEFGKKSANGSDIKRSTCFVDDHIPLRSEIISEVDKKELIANKESLDEEIWKGNRDSILQKAKEFENIFLKVIGEETTDFKETGDSEGTRCCPDNPDGDADATTLLQLNRLKIFRKDSKGADYGEFTNILKEVNSGPDRVESKHLDLLIAKSLKLSQSGQKGREITWKQSCDNELKMHKNRCGTCRFIKLAESASRQKGDDIFTFVTYIRNRLVHFEVEKSKPDGIWLKTREDVLTFAALIAPELLPHMIKVTKEKDEIKRFIEDNKLTNGSFMLHSNRKKSHKTLLDQPQSDTTPFER